MITIDDDVIDVDTCDSQTSESTATTVSTTSLDWSSAPPPAVATATASCGQFDLRIHSVWSSCINRVATNLEKPGILREFLEPGKLS